MNVRRPGVLRSFSIKNIFYDKIDLQDFFIFVWRYGFLVDIRC